jgi:hypothetical protein
MPEIITVAVRIFTKNKLFFIEKEIKFPVFWKLSSPVSTLFLNFKKNKDVIFIHSLYPLNLKLNEKSNLKNFLQTHHVIFKIINIPKLKINK